jgi:predicted acylesterase/phospholipase RssA
MNRLASRHKVGILSVLAVIPSLIGVAIAGAALTACASLERLPAVSYAQAPQTTILNISDARFYPRDAQRIASIAEQAYERRARYRPKSAPLYFLANSGGGDDGAFGAGLLVGWGERGDRPEFDVVTGVSTGALAAPFAFLGRAYDPQLKEIYTTTSADEVFQRRTILAAVTDDAMTSNAPLREMTSRYVDDELVTRIAAEYQKGRLLFILTTNLDQGRPVIWNIGAIASSGDPKARQLIIDVLLASASIPAIFPPVMIDVTIDGQKYQEMHVDGGTVAQAFLYPPSYSLRRAAAQLKVSTAALRASRKRIAYVIRNGRFARSDENVKLQTLAIAKEAIATMTTSSGVNDTYRMYLIARRDGVDFNLASIGDDFAAPYMGPFDKTYMRSLFDYGYQKGRIGYQWQKTPPGYAN